ncbi:MAG: TonB-dependent receptor [Nevskia sp.]|jgi:iron complex outermembrane receptor protein|nr:TonB-dependent receptor [Nevskia sp.]MCK9383562.1 TonB-dependent receptor [Nevskia sp.]
MQKNTLRRAARSPLQTAIWLTFVGTASVSQAQEATPAAVTSEELAPVTVTAERRNENIKDVPISISTLKDEALDVLTSGGQDVRLLAARVPSLNIESSFGRAFPRFYIRGYGNTDFDLNASQPVSLIYDEVVQENPILKGFPIFDVDQVEVLRGPQGTLFGRNTPAGVVKFDSVKPGQTREGYLNVSDATYNTANIDGAINIPLSSAWSARVSALYQHRDDYVNNTFSNTKDSLEGYNEGAARAQLLFQPSKDFSALFNVHTRQLEGTARLFRANIIKPGTNDLVDDFERRNVAIDGQNQQKLNATGGNIRLRWNIGDYALHSISGFEHAQTFSRGDIDGGFGAVFAPPSGPGFIPFPAESADGLPGHKQITQEFRVESHYNGPLNWQSGLYYFFEDIKINSFDYATLAGGSVDGFARQRQLNNALAVFASADYEVTKDFTLKGGVRYTEDRKDFSAERLISPFGAPPTGVLTAHPNAYDVSWDLSGVYTLNKDVNFYARVARGFRAPSIQGRLVFGDTLSVADTESVLSYETGVKADFFHRRARLSFDIFRSDVNNQQLTAVGGGSNFNRLLNADKSVLQGAELDFKAYLAERLLLTLGGSYNFTEIKDPNLFVAPCGSGCTVLDPAGPAAGTVSINGNSLPQAPRVTGNFTLRYAIPVTGSSEFFALTDWSYRSAVNFFLYESTEYRGKPLLEGGLRLGYNWDNGRYELAAFSRNITGTTRVVGGIDFNNLTGFINEPRIFGVQFKTRL